MFLDIAIGTMVPIFVSYLFQTEVSIGFIFFGVLSSLFPDIDIIFYGFSKYLLQNKQINHRTWTHYPILSILLAFPVFLLMGPLHGIVFSLCVIFHFIHDSIWLGWGVVWFWPFSHRRYKFFPDKNGKITNQFMMTWLPDEEESLQKELHNPHWIKDFYLRISIVSVIEYSILVFSLIILFFCFN